MARTSSRVHKHFLLDAAKIKRAQNALGAKTETIEFALDLVIAEHRKNRIVRQATERFLRSGVVIKDVYGKLG
jgi:hypothetical protein